MISLIFSPIGRAFSAAGAILLAILAIYSKGRRDARQGLEADAVADANRRMKNAVRAGDAVSSDPARLRESDGYRRD